MSCVEVGGLIDFSFNFYLFFYFFEKTSYVLQSVFQKAIRLLVSVGSTDYLVIHKYVQLKSQKLTAVVVFD